MKLGLCVTSYLTGLQLWNSSKGCNLLFTLRKSVIMKDSSLNKWHLDDPLNDSKLKFLSKHFEVTESVKTISLRIKSKRYTKIKATY